MKEIVVISGKGGTGKTSIVAAFAALAGKKFWRIVMWMRPTCILSSIPR